MSRRLVSIRRRVDEVVRPQYDRIWSQLEQATSALQCHAWRFTAVSEPAQRIEFLEFSAAGDPRGERNVAQLLQQLDQLAPGESEDWVS